MAELKVEERQGGLIFSAKVLAGSSRTAVVGVFDGMLKIKVGASAEKGKANQCLIEHLSKQLGVKKNDIEIVGGKTNPVKVIKVNGVVTESFKEKLGL